jgi:FAD/FMN-containing dehydrogenase
MPTIVQEPSTSSQTTVSDIHGQLYPTSVQRILRPTSTAGVAEAIRVARSEGRAVSIAGGRHAMGGQQFGSGTVLLDMTAMNRVLDIDLVRGEVEAEAGIMWPRLIERLQTAQAGRLWQWGIVQKQTGADRLTLGGALSANIHGRGLSMRPIVDDVVAFSLVDAEGDVHRCSRIENAELFRLAIGGYGLLGVISSVRLRLSRRRKVERVVAVLDVEDLMAAFEQRIAAGFTYGDFQFAIDPEGADFLKQGVFSCYRPVADETSIPSDQQVLSTEDWATLLYLGHADKRSAVDRYTAHYLATSGQIYWSDTHQLSEYVDHYHTALDAQLGAKAPCTEVITEMYVPRTELTRFFEDVRVDFRANAVDIIYGTVRLIERDEESFLAWAREPFACVIFNLHTEHTPEGIAQAGDAFQRLIDIAIRYGGSYYLTYHRFARRDQVERCHPRFAAFLDRKREFDPEGRFQSDWYRHYRDMFAERSGNG